MQTITEIFNQVRVKNKGLDPIFSVLNKAIEPLFFDYDKKRIGLAMDTVILIAALRAKEILAEGTDDDWSKALTDKLTRLKIL